MRLPRNLRIDDLPGPTRGESPVLYFRDEPVWSPDRKHLALAYTITEASMMNDVGCVLWGAVQNGDLTICENPPQIYACCWRSPWCRWLTDDLFVFKVQHFDGKTKRIPLVAIHLAQGFAIVPQSNTLETWVDAAVPRSLPFVTFSLAALREAIVACT